MEGDNASKVSAEIGGSAGLMVELDLKGQYKKPVQSSAFINVKQARTIMFGTKSVDRSASKDGPGDKSSLQRQAIWPLNEFSKQKEAGHNYEDICLSDVQPETLWPMQLVAFARCHWLVCCFKMDGQMYPADGESHGKGRNKCNRCIKRAKKLFMRIVPRIEDACNRTCLSRLALAFLAISALVASVGRALLKSSFTKPSHDDDDEDAIERLFTFWQIIGFCLTSFSVGDEKYFGIYYEKQSIPIKVMNALVLKPL
ncbi:hypothetical protein BTVI_133999 [Pitangus sulphuratus]|nr:hypothetical protein BTVI_133999 [Pitangus sulphuratus]